LQQEYKCFIAKRIKKKLNPLPVISQQSIDRHKYSDFVVSLSIELYLLLGCGMEKISVLLEYLNRRMQWGLEEIPCANSIGNWVKKSGYDIYKRTPNNSFGQRAAIIDESMMLGSEKMMLTLSMDAEKNNDQALCGSDVNIIDISVSDQWNSTKIKHIFTEIEEKTKTKPVYVISDNDTKLKKSIREMGYCHIPDIGHTLALAVEKIYKKEPDFMDLSAALSAVKIREVMRPASYLLPPRQRAIARFLNLSESIDWGIGVLKNDSKLTEEEQKVFGFVKTHQGLIYELHEVFTKVNTVLKRIKNNGISKKEAKGCIKMLQTKSTKSVRVQKVMELIRNYLQETSAKMITEKTVWHASSDIIESIFGTYKSRKSKNPLHGITAYVMLLPLLTKVNEDNRLTDVDCKETLERVFLKDLTDWKNKHLTENLAVKRQMKLAC